MYVSDLKSPSKLVSKQCHHQPRIWGEFKGVCSFKNHLELHFPTPCQVSPCPRPGSLQLGGGGQGKEVRTRSGQGGYLLCALPGGQAASLPGCWVNSVS